MAQKGRVRQLPRQAPDQRCETIGEWRCTHCVPHTEGHPDPQPRFSSTWQVVNWNRVNDVTIQ